MSRTKGAKGIKTLAKEAGMTVEQYKLALEKGLNPKIFSPPLEGQIEFKEIEPEKEIEKEI